MQTTEKNPWKILSEEIKYDNPWIHVTEYKVINPGGGQGIYGKVHFKNLAIGIVPMDEENNIYLVGQYRFPIDQYSWEIPEGGGSHDIDPLLSAQRELLEETGLKADHWEKILELHLSNSVSNEKGIIYLAKGLTAHQPMPEETEDLKVKKIPFEEAYELVHKGLITDSLTITALLQMKIRQLTSSF